MVDLGPKRVEAIPPFSFFIIIPIRFFIKKNLLELKLNFMFVTSYDFLVVSMIDLTAKRVEAIPPFLFLILVTIC
jgi:hypothetical protein